MLHLWPLILLVLAFWGTKTDARAVNVSNTWTMPQEGLNVFYRFFRDRISWFEADAVCQFHHANLVTVDNSFQFDATRDLLRELDVNDIVWIGLMRPQSSERFMWSNSRPLVTDTGYWAESLPLMDAPLCAVIDPIRDYRWHALRCGGPETASFLCEMPVPAWADACILKDMPNLTMQYMADTASIELIRNCAEEGLLKQSCKGKQDRDRALRELICPRERLEAQRINDITNSHFKSLQIINSIRTDNNENNDIELLPLGETSYVGSSSNSEITEQLPTEKNTVQRLIEQFNVDELMQADDPSLAMSGYHIPDEIPKPVKKSAKKVIVANGAEYQKKNREIKYDERIELPPPKPKPNKQQHLMALEDMMMGDQPQQSGEPEMLEHVGTEEDEVSNEIMEPLPHMKKVLPQDLKTMASITEKSSEKAMVGKAEEKQAHSLNIEKEIKVFPEASSTSALTTTSSTVAPTTTTTAPETTTTIITRRTTTSMSATTTAAASLSSTIVPILPTADIVSRAKIEADARKPHLSTHPIPSTVHEHSIATTLSSPSLATAHSAESAVHIHSSSYRNTTLAPHSVPKSNDFDGTASFTETPVTIGHPMHPQQQQHGIITEEMQHPHLKESVDNSHFIPPMLLVKSHYVPPLKHSEHSVSEHHGHDMAHVEHGDLQLTTGKPSDNPVYSMTPNYTPTTTTNGHMINVKGDETNMEAVTTAIVATTMTAIKSTGTTTTTDEELTKKATVDRTSALEQQQNQYKKQSTQLNAKLIDSSTYMTGNQQQQQQQQNHQQTNIKAQMPATNEMTEQIENAEGIVATTDEDSATKAAITTSASMANKLHSTTEPAKPTTTAASAMTTATTRAPTTTMKTADVDHMTHDDIEKPVKHTKPQTKEVVELTKEEIPIRTSKSLAEEEAALITTTTTTMVKLQKVEEAGSTKRLPDEETKIKEKQAATTKTITKSAVEEHTATTTTTNPTDSLAAVTTAATSTSDALTTTISAAATTAEVTATTPTYAETTTTACDTEIVESTTTIATEQSSAIEAADGQILTRVHRTCQPNYEKHNGKHSKHHAKVAAPPTPTHNFLNEETETPLYKPNRHRVLTKPETESYFKKILG